MEAFKAILSIIAIVIIVAVGWFFIKMMNNPNFFL
jgi:hypothetical protein